MFLSEVKKVLELSHLMELIHPHTQPIRYHLFNHLHDAHTVQFPSYQRKCFLLTLWLQNESAFLFCSGDSCILPFLKNARLLLKQSYSFLFVFRFFFVGNGISERCFHPRGSSEAAPRQPWYLSHTLFHYGHLRAAELSAICGGHTAWQDSCCTQWGAD